MQSSGRGIRLDTGRGTRSTTLTTVPGGDHDSGSDAFRVELAVGSGWSLLDR